VLLGCSSREPQLDWTKYPASVDLGSELDRATVLSETRRIDFGDPAAKTNLLEGWSQRKININHEAVSVASSGSWSALQLMVLEPRELVLTLRVGSEMSDRQELGVKLNDRPVHTLSLEPGLQICHFTLPETSLVRGMNTLVFERTTPEKQSPGRILWSFLEIEDGEPVAAPEQRPDGLFLPYGTAIEYLVKLPENTFLTLGSTGNEQPSARVLVRGRLLGRSSILFEEELVSGPQVGSLRLPVPAGRWALITLSAAVADSAGNEGLLIVSPQLRLPEALTAEAVINELPQLQSPPPRRPNVIVYLVDTLRADRLGCYGYHKPISPAIDAFAADAVLFEQTLAQSSWTRSAIASIFTGMVPPGHGVFDREDGLTDEAVTLAEVVRGAGYDTASIVTSGHISPQWRMSQGFDTFKLIRENDMGLLYALSNGVNPPVFEWLDRPRERPFFLYIHTLDPHSPYDPPGEAARKFAANVREPDVSPEIWARLEKIEQRRTENIGIRSPIKIGAQTWMDALKWGVITPTPTMVKDINALYDAEVHYNDIHFGELINHLRETGLYDNTIIFFISDHGEEFLDHESWTHGHSLYQEQLWIPLIIHIPDAAVPRGSRVKGLARQIDIGVTVTDYLGLPAPPEWQGSSLLPMMLGLNEYGSQRSGYAHLELDKHFGETYIEGGWKLVCSDPQSKRCRLFDLNKDPEEQVDLASSQPKVAAEMKKKMILYRDSSKRLEAFQAEPDEETRKQLEALGYIF
jgi:arylsulfatase A-like enzyme